MSALNEARALLQATADHPDDDTMLLVAVDWLQDNGVSEARCLALRQELAASRTENGHLFTIKRQAAVHRFQQALATVISACLHPDYVPRTYRRDDLGVPT